MPAAQWLVVRVVDTYMNTFGGEYADQMRVLDALRVVWSQRHGECGLIANYIAQRESDLREKAQLPSNFKPHCSAWRLPEDGAPEPAVASDDGAASAP
jgi:hypothetical protein